MASCTVPVALEGFGVERDLDAEFLSNSLEEVSGHPEMISHFDSLAGTDLEFPLRWHNFGVDTADLDSGVQAGLVVGFYDIPGVDLAGSDTAVVWALWAGEAASWPSVGSVEGVEKSVFLLETEPGIVFLVLFHQFGAFGTVVEFVGCAVRVVAF